MKQIFILIIFSAFAFNLFGAELFPGELVLQEMICSELPKGEEVLKPDGFAVSGANGELTTVDVKGMPFKTAAHISVKEKAANSWAVQYKSERAVDMGAGDVMLAAFYARAGDCDNAEGTVQF